MRRRSLLDWGDRLDERVMGWSWRKTQAEDGPVLAAWRQLHPVAESPGVLGMADRLDRRLLRGRPSTVIGVPMGKLASAAIADFRFWLVVILCLIVAITIPSPLGGILAVVIAVVYRNRLWWKLHDKRREMMLAEIATNRPVTIGSSEPVG
jgi:hypothetical protein